MTRHIRGAILPLFACGVSLSTAAVASAFDLQLTESHTVIDCVLSQEPHNQGTSKTLVLPQLRVYDIGGRQVLDNGTGYDEEDFVKTLGKTLAEPNLVDSQTTRLDDEVSQLRDPLGEPLRASSLPLADFTIVKYWAEWCLPCREQARALERVLAEHTTLRITVLNVEADANSDAKNVRQIRPEDLLTPDELKYLQDPTTTTEQRVRLLEKALANGPKVSAAQTEGGKR